MCPQSKLTSGKGRTARISIKTSPLEKSCLQDRAQAVNMSLTDYLIWTGLYGEQMIFPIDLKEISSIRTELARQGNNLNQIAHVANIMRHKRAGQDDRIDDILGMLLRLNEAHHNAYNSVRELQEFICKSQLKRHLL